LEALEKEIKSTIETLPEEKRILVTAHDAFNYFGKSYGFEVVGLQGLSTKPFKQQCNQKVMKW